MRPRLRFRAFAALLVTVSALGAFGAPGVRAQEPPPEQQGQEIPPLVPRAPGQTGTDPTDPFGTRTEALPLRSPGIVTRLPYANWKAHTGTAAESVALLRIGTADGPASTGLVIRCDGFILIPLNVVQAQREGTPVVVTVTGAENEELTGPVAVAGRIHFMSGRCPFGVLKVNDHHLRCLPLLNPIVVKPGVPVLLVTALPGDKPGLCKSVTKEAVVGAKTMGVSNNTDEDAYLIDGVTGGAPVGTVVVDKETGAAIGMVMVGGTKPSFSTFATLYDVCNEIGLAPDREAIKERKTASVAPPQVKSTTLSAAKENETVWVPGGPVQLDGDLGEYYQKTFKTTIACTPGFFIDTHMVTREEYEAWAKEVHLGVDQGVTKPFVAVPPEYADNDELAKWIRKLPISINRSWEAQYYAAAHGKRLPTSVEWRRAALCDDLRWAIGLMDNYEGQLRTLYGLVQQHKMTWIEAMMTPHQNSSNRPGSRGGVRGGGARGGRAGGPFDPTAFNGMSPEDASIIVKAHASESQQFTDAIHRVAGGIKNTMPDSYPWIVVPVGWRTNDKSMFGMVDVLMNIPEHVLPIGKGFRLAPKLYPAKADLFESYIQTRAGSSNNPVEALKLMQGRPFSKPIYVIALFAADGINSPAPFPEGESFTGDQSHLGMYVYGMFALRGISLDDYWFAADPTVAYPTFLGMELRTTPVIGIGFRGAR